MSSGCLHLVATPIGSLGDLSPRAQEILARVDLVLAEDTRSARRLLSALELPSSPRRLRRFDQHAEQRDFEAVLERLLAGAELALISDAGTPVLCDPGYLLVKAAREAGVTVLSAPGPSAFVTALAASGLPPLPALLLGFLPPKGGARRQLLERLVAAEATGVLFISPHRGSKELALIAEVLGADTEAVLLSELSKCHERACGGRLGALVSTEIDWRGEHVLVTAPVVAKAVVADPASVAVLYTGALGEGLSRPQALRQVAKVLGIPRREVYRLLEAGSDAGLDNAG